MIRLYSPTVNSLSRIFFHNDFYLTYLANRYHSIFYIYQYMYHTCNNIIIEFFIVLDSNWQKIDGYYDFSNISVFLFLTFLHSYYLLSSAQCKDSIVSHTFTRILYFRNLKFQFNLLQSFNNFIIILWFSDSIILQFFDDPIILQSYNNSMIQ